MLDLVHAGDLVPSGTRWTWPAARAGRLDRDQDFAANAGKAPTADCVRLAATSGRRDQAIAMWQRAAAQQPEAEAAFRTALVEGLLDGGEPAHALPLCGDLPVLHAQALFDTGQVAAARRELAAIDAPATAARHRRVAAQLELAVGNREEAARMLGIGERTLYRKIKEYEDAGYMPKRRPGAG